MPRNGWTLILILIVNLRPHPSPHPRLGPAGRTSSLTLAVTLLQGLHAQGMYGGAGADWAFSGQRTGSTLDSHTPETSGPAQEWGGWGRGSVREYRGLMHKDVYRCSGPCPRAWWGAPACMVGSSSMHGGSLGWRHFEAIGQVAPKQGCQTWATEQTQDKGQNSQLGSGQWFRSVVQVSGSGQWFRSVTVGAGSRL